MIYVIYLASLITSFISTPPLIQGPNHKPYTPQGNHNMGPQFFTGYKGISLTGNKYG